MWHEARRSEKKVHDMMDAARKRAQRRAIYLAKRRGDPQQSIQAVGSRCRIHRDDSLYQATEDQQGLGLCFSSSCLCFSSGRRQRVLLSSLLGSRLILFQLAPPVAADIFTPKCENTKKNVGFMIDSVKSWLSFVVINGDLDFSLFSSNHYYPYLVAKIHVLSFLWLYFGLKDFFFKIMGVLPPGTRCGFRIYNCDPFKETFRRDLKSGGFKIVEMLFRCNVLALIGSKVNTQYPPNKVIIWDDHQSRVISEFSFRSEVRAVKLRRDSVVVVLEHKIYVYNFMDLKLLHQIQTLVNPRGLCCLSQHMNTSVLACPGLRWGQVRVEHFGLNMTKLINAQDSKIACLTLTMDGLLLAIASVRGTLIRIFNTIDGTRLQEVRRGMDKANIYCIATLVFLINHATYLAEWAQVKWWQ